MINVVYSARYQIDIGLHVFPTRKYQLVHDRLIEAGIVGPAEVIEPQAASVDELALVHTRDYLANIREGSLSIEELAELELPWSEQMVDGFQLMVGGTIDAACLACGLEVGRVKPEVGSGGRSSPSDFKLQTSHFSVVCHIGGGFHHAFPNHGEGFCPFNDVAVAVRVMQAAGFERVAIVDLDVHHGNGTAFVFESDPRVFTFSMHQQHNYPMWKPRGSLDVGLSDGAHDATFLARLEETLPRVVAHKPQCVFYLAGADPYEDDLLGGLRLTQDGLRKRDRMVFEAFRAAAIPVVVTLAGGYARRVEDTVAIHVATIEEAKNAATKARTNATTKTRKHEEKEK